MLQPRGGQRLHRQQHLAPALLLPAGAARPDRRRLQGLRQALASRSSTCSRQADVKFALEVHPTEIAFDIASAARALEAVNGHKRFGFNFDPSHLGYQGVDSVEFIREFRDRIFHVHMKDVYWSLTADASGRLRRPPGLRPPGPVLGLPLAGPRLHQLRGDHPRAERGRLPRPAVGRMGRQRHGPRARGDRGSEFVRRMDFATSGRAFDSAFAEDRG